MRKRVHISECTDADVLAEDIMNRYGAIVLPCGTVTNQYIVRKLDEMGIEHVLVSEGKWDDDPEYASYHAFEKKYKNCIGDLKQLVLNLIKGNNIEYARIREIADTVISAQKEPGHIIECLRKIKNADNHTYFHSVNVSFYAMLIAGWLNLTRDDINTVIQAALMHDLGKAKIPNDLLNKKEKLSTQEFEEIKRHAIYGYELLKDNAEIPDDIKDVVLMHHEREDGSGYPLHKGSDGLSIYTKIVSVADVYDAMTSSRPYKKALTPFDAFEELLTVCRGCMDSLVINALIYNLSRYYTGSKVVLNNGQTANIAYIPPHCVYKPIIDTGSGLLDLSRETEIFIVAMA